MASLSTTRPFPGGAPLRSALAAVLLAAARRRNHRPTGRLQATRAANDQNVWMGLRAAVRCDARQWQLCGEENIDP